jgi:hypothetical protein
VTWLGGVRLSVKFEKRELLNTAERRGWERAAQQSEAQYRWSNLSSRFRPYNTTQVRKIRGVYIYVHGTAMGVRRAAIE